MFYKEGYVFLAHDRGGFEDPGGVGFETGMALAVSEAR